MSLSQHLRFVIAVRALVLAVVGVVGCNVHQVEPPDGATEGTTDAPDTTPTTGDAACLGPLDCYACPPETPVHLLNVCTDATCEPFVNATRLPRLNADGSLPPLP